MHWIISDGPVLVMDQFGSIEVMLSWIFRWFTTSHIAWGVSFSKPLKAVKVYAKDGRKFENNE